MLEVNNYVTGLVEANEAVKSRKELLRERKATERARQQERENAQICKRGTSREKTYNKVIRYFSRHKDIASMSVEETKSRFSMHIERKDTTQFIQSAVGFAVED